MLHALYVYTEALIYVGCFVYFRMFSMYRMFYTRTGAGPAADAARAGPGAEKGEGP